MGKRKIGKSSVKYTGKKNTSKNDELIEFESLIEKDYLELLDFDDDVQKVTSQPETIKIDPKYSLDKKSYTPDFLVEFQKKANKKNLLVEIKPEIELKKNPEYFDKLKLALFDYCKPLNWEFIVVTENSIRNDYLDNVSRLNYYKSQNYNKTIANQVLEILETGANTFLELINSISNNDTLKQDVIHSIWCLLSNKIITCDLSIKISFTTLLYIKSNERNTN
jgi:hypothetical protein